MGNNCASVGRFALLAMAGRRRPLGMVAVVAAILLLVLTCIGQLLEVPGPSRTVYGQFVELFKVSAFENRLTRQSAFWNSTQTMQVLIGLYLAIDTFLFLPAYAGLLTGLRDRWAKSLSPSLRAVLRWRRWRWLLGTVVLADLIENLLTWCAVQGWLLADALRYATIVKWTSFLVLLVAVAAVAVVRASLLRNGQWRVSGKRILEALRDSARYLWLHAIPLAMLFGGLALLAGVPQSREIIADLGDVTTGSASRLTTLTVTSLMLVVWIAATGLAFSLVRKVDPLSPSDDTHLDRDQVAALPRTHQLLLGLGALVATNAVLVRMSATQGAALSLFIVAGCIGLWVLTSRACTVGFKAVGLPQHRQARPVAWRSVAMLMLLYVLVVASWRFLPSPREDHVRAWGLFRKPDGFWRFSADLIDGGAGSV